MLISSATNLLPPYASLIFPAGPFARHQDLPDKKNTFEKGKRLQMEKKVLKKKRFEMKMVKEALLY